MEFHGFMRLSNWGGIAIELDSAGESVRYQYYGKTSKRRCRVKFTDSGRAYFRALNRRWYLDEFLKA